MPIQVGALGAYDLCLARCSARTAAASSPRPTTTPRGCGTPRPARRSQRSRGIQDPVNSAVFSPDGSRVVTASEDNTARLWDAKTGAALATLSGHTDTVDSAVFSPDGSRVVTASTDKTARLWDAKTGARARHALGAYGSGGKRSVQPGRQPRRHRVLRQHRAAVGRQDRRGARNALGAYGLRCIARCSARTAAASSPRPTTTPRGCGTPRPARRSPRSRSIRNR